MTPQYLYVKDSDGDYEVYNPRTNTRLGWVRRIDDANDPWNHDFYLMRPARPAARTRNEAVQAAINDAYRFIAEAKEGMS